MVLIFFHILKPYKQRGFSFYVLNILKWTLGVRFGVICLQSSKRNMLIVFPWTEKLTAKIMKKLSILKNI